MRSNVPIGAVAAFVSAFVVSDSFGAGFPTGDAWPYALVLQGFAEPISVVTTIPKQPFNAWQAAQQRPRSNIVADLPGRNEEVDWPTLAVTDGMELGIHATFGPAPSRDICCANTLSGSESGVHAPFFHAHTCRSAVCLQKGGVDHDGLFLTVFGGQAHHDLGKDTFLTPPLPAVV